MHITVREALAMSFSCASPLPHLRCVPSAGYHPLPLYGCTPASWEISNLFSTSAVT